MNVTMSIGSVTRRPRDQRVAGGTCSLTSSHVMFMPSSMPIDTVCQPQFVRSARHVLGHVLEGSPKGRSRSPRVKAKLMSDSSFDVNPRG